MRPSIRMEAEGGNPIYVSLECPKLKASKDYLN
jgi:hypothetical protein